MIQLLIPPGHNGGVHDFSIRLNEEIGNDAGSVVHFSKTNAMLCDPADTVILQFSGYGFEKRGTPLWLLRELEQRRTRIKNLGIYFHELYAFGPPWSSSFWLSPTQRHIARRLADLSDFWMTNREGSAQWLRGFAGDKPHAVLPVFSNVGESAATARERAPRIMVFGSAGLRQNTYRAAGERLFAWAQQASLEIHDIGPAITDGGLSATLHSTGVIQHGQLDANQVDRLMRDARYGVVAYPVAYAAKSGVFAAYAAHGMCPVLLSAEHLEADGLKAGVHYLPELPDFSATADIDSIRQAAWAWYQPHSVARHAKTLMELLDSSSRAVRC